MRDNLIFELDSGRYALPTSEVDKVITVDRLSYMPGQSGIISGVVSLGGEPVTVVDARSALGLDHSEPGAEGIRKIVVLRSGSKMLGLDIGSAAVNFSWAARPGKTEADTEEAENGPGPDAARAELNRDNTVEQINWLALFDKAAAILKETGA